MTQAKEWKIVDVAYQGGKAEPEQFGGTYDDEYKAQSHCRFMNDACGGGYRYQVREVRN